ncbi:MAG: HlyD family efflux transporter periplasmic adaptor subunit [Thermoguttaceae bacterium]|nr:HlyD family efflux transporter periplasmic adaptor subunit [Thermoguttaceae bacterium]
MRDSLRRGGAVRTLLVALLFSSLFGGGIWWGWTHFVRGGGSKTSVIYSKVTRGTFVHEIIGKGNAQSAKNVDVTCQVESNAGTTIIWLVPEGEYVKKGDRLVVLDSSDLEDKASTQQITCNTNSASVASSRASLRTAELSLEEYIEGTFEQNWMTIENDIYTAREEQKKEADSVAYTKKLVQFGYTTTVQLESALVAEQKQVNTLKSNLLKQEVLLRYTSEKEITKLMADIETARAKLSSDTYSAEVAKNRLDHFLQQLEYCVIRAPADGQVVYANEDVWRESDMIQEGSKVYANYVIVRLPDPMEMQVKAMINESNIANVKIGMKARIVFDALASQSFEGTVSKVNQYPEAKWMSSSKDYVTIIDIDNPSDNIRSGLTAQVQIEAQRIDDVLMVPVQCIVEVAKKNYVITYADGQWGFKEVKLGPSNDKQVVIEEGLSEGDQVVSGARQYKNKVHFPGMSKKTESEEEKNEIGGIAPPLPSDGPIPGAGAPVGPLPGAAPGDGSPGEPLAEKPKRKEKTAEEEERDQMLLDYLVSLIRRAENDEFARLESLVPYFGLTAMEVCQKADADADKQITRDEISEELPLCLPFFGDWDRSKKGTLSRTDLVIGFCSARIKYQRMQQTLSDDENEQSAMKFVFKKEPSEIFTFLDRSRDNVIDTDDAPEGEVEEFAEMIARFDVGNDGRVNADEFSKGIARFKQEIGQISAVKNSSDAPQGEPPK